MSVLTPLGDRDGKEKIMKKPKYHLFVVTYAGIVHPKIFDTYQQAVNWAQANDDIKVSFTVDSFTHPGMSKEDLRVMVQDFLDKSTSTLH